MSKKTLKGRKTDAEITIKLTSGMLKILERGVYHARMTGTSTADADILVEALGAEGFTFAYKKFYPIQ